MTIWLYILFFFAGFILWMLLYKATQWLDQKIVGLFHKEREKRFLRFVQIKFPDRESITSISVSTSDKKALENIERRLHDYY